MNLYLSFWAKSFDFESRARRKEIWVSTVLNPLVFLLGLALTPLLGWGWALFLYVVWTFFIFIPTISQCVRRLHDTNKSGWLLLLIVVPVINLVLLWLLYISGGNEAHNRFGVNPKGSRRPERAGSSNTPSQRTIGLTKSSPKPRDQKIPSVSNLQINAVDWEGIALLAVILISTGMALLSIHVTARAYGLY